MLAEIGFFSDHLTLSPGSKLAFISYLKTNLESLGRIRIGFEIPFLCPKFTQKLHRENKNYGIRKMSEATSPLECIISHTYKLL